MSEYAYSIYEKDQQPVWIVHTPAFEDAQAALKEARAQNGPQVTVQVAEIQRVRFDDIRPSAEQLLGDMKERLVNIAGIGSDVLLDALPREKIDSIDKALTTALESAFNELNIPTDFGAFRIVSTRNVIPGQAWA